MISSTDKELMANANGQTNLGLDKREVVILIDALQSQSTENMNAEGLKAQAKLIKRLLRSEGRLVTPKSWNSCPWS